MKLSTIFELLLIFLLIAFAAYGRVIDSNGQAAKKFISKQTSAAPISLKQATENVNKYCVCNENICNCCRDFHIPLVQLSGPGCASLQYLQDNKLAMQLSIGDNILSSNIVNGNNPKPVCVNLPGGFSKFCGKIYSIKKEADKHFKACLGLELRSASELEASLRVSCFRFGPDGLKLRPAEPLPPTLSAPSTNTDDDYDDIFGLDEDDEDDEDDEETDNDDFEKVSAQNPSGSLSAEQENQEQAAEEDEDDDDLLGLSALLDIFTSDDESTSNKKTRPTSSTPLPTSFTIPILTLTSTSSPAIDALASGSSIPTTSVLNKAPTTTTSTSQPQSASTEKTVENISDTTVSNDQTIDADTVKTLDEDDAQTSIGITEINYVPSETEKVEKLLHGKKSKYNATEIKQANKKRVGITSTKVHNTTNIKKIETRPQVADHGPEADDSSESIYDDQDDQDDEQDDDDDDDDDDDTKKNEAANETDKTADSEGAETSDNDYDHSYESDEDEDEDEDADVQVMSTLLEDEVSTEKTYRGKNKVKTNKTNIKVGAPAKSDYDYELSEILGRKYSNPTNKKGVKRKVAHKTRP